MTKCKYTYNYLANNLVNTVNCVTGDEKYCLKYLYEKKIVCEIWLRFITNRQFLMQTKSMVRWLKSTMVSKQTLSLFECLRKNLKKGAEWVSRIRTLIN